jgi:hypothetical protein
MMTHRMSFGLRLLLGMAVLTTGSYHRSHSRRDQWVEARGCST